MANKVTKMAPKQKAQEKNKNVAVEEFAKKAGELINLIGLDSVKDEDALTAFQNYTAAMAEAKSDIENLNRKVDKVKEIIKKYSRIEVGIDDLTKEDYAMIANEGDKKLIKRRIRITYFGEYDMTIKGLAKMLRTSDDETEEELIKIANTMMYRIYQASDFVASTIAMRADELDTKCFMYAVMRCIDNSPEYYEKFKEGIIKDIVEYVYSKVTKDDIANLFLTAFWFR